MLTNVVAAVRRSTTALGAILRASEAKALPCGVFGSFGWSGEAVDEMEARLRDAGFQFGFEPIRVKFKPTAGQLQVGTLTWITVVSAWNTEARPFAALLPMRTPLPSHRPSQPVACPGYYISP